MPRPAVAALLALVPLLSAAGPAAAAASVTQRPTLVDVQLSRSAVTVSGLQGVKVTVSVHLTSPDGVYESTNLQIPAPWPSARLQRTSGHSTAGAPQVRDLDLDLTSGTAKDGIWTATTLVPSTYEGTWQVTNVKTGDTDEQTGGTGLSVDPRTIGIVRTLTVTATHQPAITLHVDPPVVVGVRGPVAVKGRVVDADTGAPVAGILLTLATGASENCGAFGYGGSAWTATDARGYYVFRRADNDSFCVISPLPQRRHALDQYRDTTLLFRASLGAKWLPVVSAAPDRTTVDVGDTVAIRGRVAPAGLVAGGQIVLQRLVGRHWRQVGTTSVRSSSRYTLYATPPSRGPHLYRSVTVARGTVLSGVSPTIRITAR